MLTSRHDLLTNRRRPRRWLAGVLVMAALGAWVGNSHRQDDLGQTTQEPPTDPRGRAIWDWTTQTIDQLENEEPRDEE